MGRNVQQVDEKILIKVAWSLSGVDKGRDDDFHVKLRLGLVGPKAWHQRHRQLS